MRKKMIVFVLALFMTIQVASPLIDIRAMNTNATKLGESITELYVEEEVLVQSTTVGSDYEVNLPSSIQVVYNDTTKQDVEVVWNEVDDKVFSTKSSGNYTYELSFKDKDVAIDSSLVLPIISVTVAGEQIQSKAVKTDMSVNYYISYPVAGETTRELRVVVDAPSDMEIKSVEVDPVGAGNFDPVSKVGADTVHDVTLNQEYKITIAYELDGTSGTSIFYHVPSDATNFTYEVVDGSVKLKSYKQLAPKEMYVPSTVTVDGVTYPVSELGEGLATNYSLTKLTFESGSQITTIGKNAFSGNDFTEVVLPDSVISLADYAFSNNIKLTNINIPKNLEEMSNGIFDNCTSLAINLEVPSTVTSIGTKSFNNVPLTGLTMHHGITSIGDYAFYGNNIQSFMYKDGDSGQLNILPNKLEYLGSYSFYGSDIESIQIGSNITTISSSAFRESQNLTTVVVDEGVVGIDGSAFQNIGLSSLDSVQVYLPETLTKIGDNAFSTNISTVALRDEYGNSVIPGTAQLSDNVETIGWAAFQGNTFSSIEIGTTINGSLISQIKQKAFTPKDGINQESFKIHCASTVALLDNPWGSNVEYIEYDDTKITAEYVYYADSGTIVSYKGDSAVVNIPDEIEGHIIKIIGTSAFVGTDVQKVTFPPTIEEIGPSAFANVSTLNEINFSTNSAGETAIKTIDDAAFIRTGLENLTLPKSVEYIGISAFYAANNLENIILNSNGKLTLDTTSFGGLNTGKLDTFIINHDGNIEDLTINSAFNGSVIGYISIPNYEKPNNSLGQGEPWGATSAIVLWADSKLIDVDGDSKTDYIFSIETNTIQKYLGEETDVVIPDYFEIVENGQSITYPVTTIGKAAFKANEKLTTVVLPSELTSISDEAFMNCTNLTTVIFNETLTTIGSSSFENCDKLQYSSLGADGELPKNIFIIPDSITTYGKSAFANTGIVHLEFPLGDGGNQNLFRNSSELLSAKMTDGNDTGYATFYGCDKLTTVTFPEGLEIINSATFEGTAITTMVIPEGVNSIGANAFKDTKNLTTIIFPESYTNMYYSIFGTSNPNDDAVIEQIIIPSTVTNVSSSAFEGKRINNIFVMQSKSTEDWRANLGWGADMNDPATDVKFAGEIIVFESEVIDPYDSNTYSRTLKINASTDDSSGLKISKITVPEIDVQPSIRGQIINVNNQFWNSSEEDKKFTYEFTEPGTYFFYGEDTNGQTIGYPVVIEEIGKPSFTKDDEGNHLTNTNIVIPTTISNDITVEELLFMINPQASTIEFPTTSKYNESSLYFDNGNEVDRYTISDGDLSKIHAIGDEEIIEVELTTTSGTGLTDKITILFEGKSYDPPIVSVEITQPETSENSVVVKLNETVKLNATAILDEGNAEDLTYQWYSSTSANQTGEIIDGAINSEYNVDSTKVGTLYYYVVVTDTRTNLNTTSTTLMVEVEPFKITLDATDGLFVDGIGLKQIVEYTNNEGKIKALEVLPTSDTLVLIGWIYEDELLTTAQLQDIVFTSDAIISAVWLDDVLVDTDKDLNGNEPGDGIPDIYQTIVKFQVVNGVFEGGITELEEVVTFELGDNYSQDKTATCDVAMPLAMIPNEGYHGGNWNVNETKVYYTDQVITFVYTYEINEYTIVFNSNGANGTMENQTIQYGQDVNITPNEFTMENAEFLGWSTAPDGLVEYADGQSIVDLTIENDVIVDLYAVWQVRDVPVIVDPETPDIQEPEIPATQEPETSPTPIPEPQVESEVDTFVEEEITDELLDSNDTNNFESTAQDAEFGIGDNNQWALINLISMLLTVIYTIYLFMTRKKVDTVGYSEHIRLRKKTLLTMNVVFTVVSITLFVITQDLTQPMKMVDNWTLLFVGVIVAQTLLTLIYRRSDNENTQPPMSNTTV